MAKARDILKSGALGLGPALMAKNPDMMRGFGLLGNLAANKMEDRDERKRQAAMMGMPTPDAAAPAMKKGGKVKSKKYAKGGYVKSADGICKKGHTKGKMI
jgi:hypothetical protein